MITLENVYMKIYTYIYATDVMVEIGNRLSSLQRSMILTFTNLDQVERKDRKASNTH